MTSNASAEQGCGLMVIIGGFLILALAAVGLGFLLSLVLP